MTRWAAPVAARPLHGTIGVPGSKSVTARALVLAALAHEPSVLHGVLDSRDSRLMRDGLSALGANLVSRGGALRVNPIKHVTRGATVDCGLAGTVLRFLPPVAALGAGTTRFIGDEQAAARPVAPLLDALVHLGVRVSDPYRLPFTVNGAARRPGGLAGVDASTSSQFISGLLLAAPRFEDGLTVVHTGATLPSVPHIDMTVAMLRARGVVVDASAETWTVKPGAIAGGEVWIEPDLTNAVTLLAAALVTGGELETPWPTNSLQAGDDLLGVLAAFGASVSLVDPVDSDGDPSSGPRIARVSGELHGANVDLCRVSELTPVAAALAALADSPSSITGVAHIRGHETDRLAALATELTALGADVLQTPDGLVVTPRPLRPVRDFRTYGDHRMAHAAALIGLVTPGIVVDDIGVTTKTLTHFPSLWRGLAERV